VQTPDSGQSALRRTVIARYRERADRGRARVGWDRHPRDRLTWFPGDADMNTLIAADPQIDASWSGSEVAAPGIHTRQIAVPGTVKAGQL